MSARRLFRYLGWTLLFLFLATVVWAGVYVYKQGFTRKWRQIVAEEFRKQGIDVTFRRLQLDPFKGIVARNLKLMDVRNSETVIANIDEVVLDLNYGNLLHGGPFLNAVNLREANISLPVDPSNPKSKRFEINRLSANVQFPAQEAYLNHAEADVYGIRLTASGRLINLNAFKPSESDEDENTEKRTAAVLRMISELKALEFRSGAPSLDIRFAGDMANLDDMFVEVSLEGRKIVRRGYMMEELSLTARYRDRVLNLAGLNLRDEGGLLEVTGDYDDRSKVIDAHLRSSVDLMRLMVALGVKLPFEEVEFRTSPKLEVFAKGEIADVPEVLLTGELDAKDFSVRGVAFESLETDFSWAGARWSVRDLTLRHASGEVKGDAMQLEDSFRAELVSTLDPTVFSPFVEGKPAIFVSEWEFEEPPEIRMNAEGSSPSSSDLVIDGEVKFGPTVFRGQSMKSGSTKFHVQDRAATYKDFRIERKEGSASGTFIYDFGRKEVVLKDVRTRVIPAEVAAWISLKLVRHIVPYRFEIPPDLRINGLVHYQRGDMTELFIDVRAPEGMEYTFLGKELSFPRVSGNLKITPGRLEIDDLDGSLYGGKVTGKADISLIKEEPGYSAEIEVEGVDFPKLTSLYFGYDTSEGKLKGWFQWRGKTKDPRTIDGSGRLNVVDGDVFAIPTLGPLSAILNGIVPKMGYSIAKEAAASFTIREGVIRTDDFSISADAFELQGEGALFFLENDIDFDIRITARGIPGILLFPVSKLFEYTAEGTLRKPEWSPKNLPGGGD